MNKIGGHPQKFICIYVRDVVAECERLATEDQRDVKQAFRYADRRLQALRKSGAIKTTTKGWLRAQAKQI